MQLITGKIKTAQKCLIYGPEGIGKSTFASLFPNPVFIDTEGSTKHMDVVRTPRPSSWTMLLQQVNHFISNPTKLSTLVIDTADWAEDLCASEICAKGNKNSIEDFNYGKGYTYLEEEFGRLLNRLEDLVDKGVHVVLAAHAMMRKFEQPDESGAYDRWELKLQKKTAPLVKEWADMVLFANYKTFVVKSEDKKNKAQGGKRVMYTSHHPCWDAKNRHGLAEELPFDYQAIVHCFANLDMVNPTSTPITAGESEPPVTKDEPTELPKELAPRQTEPEISTGKPTLPTDIPFDDYAGVPKALADLMMANNVSVSDIQKIVAYRGYYPEDAPISNYDPKFVDGVLVGAWPQVFAMIQAAKEDKPY